MTHNSPAPIRHEALNDVCVALHQLGMQEFLVDLNRFIRENHATLRMPPPVFGISSAPSASSSLVTPSEAVFFWQAETEHDHLQGVLTLMPSHFKYSNACFQCHRLGHL